MKERVAVRDTTPPRGGGADDGSPVLMPKGTQALIATYSLQSRGDIWSRTLMSITLQDGMDEMSCEKKQTNQGPMMAQSTCLLGLLRGERNWAIPSI
jgi:hypothetical protein